MGKQVQKPRIVVSEKVKAQLDDLGSKNDTYEEIIVRLLKNGEKAETKD